jgi:hypothetical protein
MRLIGCLLLAEALWTLPTLAALVYTIAAYDALAVTIIAARGVVTAAQLSAALLLLQRRPPGPPIARLALLGAAILITLEAGFNLAPSIVYVFWRWQAVTVYWAYALAAIWWLRDGVTS